MSFDNWCLAADEGVVRPSREQLEACEKLVVALAALNKATQAARGLALHVEFTRFGSTFDVKCEVRTVVKGPVHARTQQPHLGSEAGAGMASSGMHWRKTVARGG